MLYRRIIPSVAVTLALAAPSAALAKPGTDVTGSGSNESSGLTAVQSTDLRSPDARDAAAGTAGSTAVQDLRSPDARDAASGTGALTAVQDLRSPDARDAAVGPVPVQPVAPVAADDGFEWGSAGIGAAAMLAIVLGVAALVALVVPRRRMHRSPIPH